jgi:hypothetical protein
MLIKYVKHWWGDSDADFNSFLGLPYRPSHWSAKLIRSLLQSFKTDWKWWLTFLVGGIALVVKLV